MTYLHYYMYSREEMEVSTEIVKISIDEPIYPAWLREIADPPKEIYVRGKLGWQLPVVAIVGSRKPTAYGVQVTAQLVETIAGQSIVVSGLAYGIDAQAHRSAVKKNGITVAVLGSGIDDASIYPTSHLGLANEILRTGGALISEYPPGTPPLPHHFPQRNRIIAGLSQKIVVVEAAEGSGALITARLGLDYNREVLAVPGMVTNPNAWGPNQLIAEGAKPVLKPSDVIEIVPEKIKEDLTETEEIVYNTLVSGPRKVDELVQLTGLPASEINMIVTLLEMRGIIMQLGGGSFGVK